MTNALRRVLTGATLLVLVLIVVRVRLVPRELLSATDRARREVRNELEAQVMHRLSQDAASSQGAPGVSALFDESVSANQPQLEAATEEKADRFKAESTYTAADGQSYPFLGGFDSYLWLRYARNLLRSGDPCDAVVNGACRDTHTDAPVGSTSPYAQRLHVAAIAGLHRIVSRLRPGYPLDGTAFLIPVIVGALGVIPAFFLGRFVGGNVGAVFAAIFTAIHPAVLSRTMSGDNDIWNVVLPLYAMWATVAALRSERTVRTLSFSSLAGVCIGLQAWAWSGWIFIYAVIVAGCMGALLLQAGHFVFQRKSVRVWQSEGVRRIGLVLLSFYAASAICTMLADASREYFTAPVTAARALIGTTAGSQTPDALQEIQWPNALGTVAELGPMQFSGIAQGLGGGAVLFIALIGLILVVLRGSPWRSWKTALLFGAGSIYAAGLFLREPSPIAAVVIVSVTILAAIAVPSLHGQVDIGHQAAACLLAVWMVAALYAAFHGVRFMLLLAPPLGLSAAAAIGSGAQGALGVARNGSPWYRRTTYAALGVVVVIFVLQPLQWGYAMAREDVPQMNSAWWTALKHLHEDSAPDAIVHTWWDYGAWVSYAAERRVVNDGTSLQTHIPVWVGKTLAAPREEDSVGLLRMLGCGSELTPFEGGSQGAYGKLLALRRSPLEAYTMLKELIAVDQPQAEAYLAGRGVGRDDRANILLSTHCTPPESYLILSSKMVQKRGVWMSFGLWNPASPLAPSAATISAATSPRVSFLPRWVPCNADPEQVDCEIQAKIPPNPEMYERFVAAGAAPPRLISHRGPALVEGPPAVVIRAGRDGINLTPFASSPYPNLGVLLDVVNHRILIGAPEFLESTFVHLMYLDGRYAVHYEKTDDRATSDERVVTWKVNWAPADATMHQPE